MIESAANEPAIEIVGGDSENQTWFGGKCSLYIDLDPPSTIKNDVLPYNYHNYTTFSNLLKVFGGSKELLGIVHGVFFSN
jgi:hypothetical protein